MEEKTFVSVFVIQTCTRLNLKGSLEDQLVPGSVGGLDFHSFISLFINGGVCCFNWNNPETTVVHF